MKLIIGLGNPGEKYINTRHNVGFMVIDMLAGQVSDNFLGFERNRGLQCEIVKIERVVQGKPQTFLLAKPNTFMNDSGKAVKKLVDFYKIKIDDLYVIHDDLDMRLGLYKIQKGKGPHEHKGILSIEEELKDKDFWRVRVGVDNRNARDRVVGEAYVLDNFTPEENKILQSTIIKLLDTFESGISLR